MSYYFYKNNERYYLKDGESIDDYCIIKGYKVKWIRFEGSDVWIKPAPISMSTDDNRGVLDVLEKKKET